MAFAQEWNLTGRLFDKAEGSLPLEATEIMAHPINSGERKKILSLHHGKFNVRVFGKLHAAIQYIIPFYNSKSRK